MRASGIGTSKAYGPGQKPAGPTQNYETAATLTIHNAGEMTPAARKAIAAWLREHAAALTKDGKNYAKRFRGRYFFNRK